MAQYTVNDIFALPDAFRCELIDGEIFHSASELKEGLYTMCNLSYDIEEKAAEKATRETREQERLNSIKNIMDSLKLSAQQAMEALKIPEDEQPKYLSKI